jgi:hypothetical protein
MERYDPLIDALGVALDLLDQCQQRAYTAGPRLREADIAGLKGALMRAVKAVKQLMKDDEDDASTQWHADFALRIGLIGEEA